MFEAQAAYYLNKYLGKYVDGVDPQSLSISVWDGNVILKNLRIRPEALEELNLPVTVKAGLLGTLSLKVPWNKLGKEPVIVEIDKLYVLAGPFQEHDKFESDEELNEWIQQVESRETDAKSRRVKNMELDWIQKRRTDDGKAKDVTEDEKSGGYLQYYIETILGNLELRITDVHIRYEDDHSSPGCTFAMGLTFQELSAHTVDDNGARAFINAKEMESIRKHVRLGSLSVYFDAKSDLWHPEKNWPKSGVHIWDSFFLDRMRKELKDSPRMYLLKPVDGTLRYLRRRQIGNKKRPDNVARQEVDINLKEIGVQVSRKQYEHVQNMLTLVNLYQLSLPHRHFRPPCRPINPRSRRLWWVYAMNGVRLSFLGSSTPRNHFGKLVKARMKYVPAYFKCLKDGKVGGDDTIREIDKELEEEAILVFRHLAYLKFEQSERKKAKEKAASRPATWSEWLWGSSALQTPQIDSGSSAEQMSISEADWKKLESLVGVHDDDSESSDNPWTMKHQFSVLVETCTLTMTDKADNWILYGVCSHIVAVNRIYPETNSVEFNIVAGKLSCPTGAIASTGSHREAPASSPRAISLEYTRKPQDRPVGTIVKLKCTCTFLTYQASALQSVSSFFKPVAQANFSVLEAQAAAGLVRARKRAEKQLMEILEEDRELYEITVEMDAPKLAIPKQDASRDCEECTIILDLGQLMLTTDANGRKKLAREEALVYECLQVGISDVAIFMMDGVFQWPELSSANFESTSIELEKLLSESSVVIPVLQRCGARSGIQIARGKNHGLVPVRLNFSVPHICFHFSPSVYARLMNIVDSLAKKLDLPSSNRMDMLEEVTYEGFAKLLSWEGLSRSSPTWKPHKIALKWDRLCVCKAKGSMDIIRWSRLGEDVHLIPLKREDAFGKLNAVVLSSAWIDNPQLAVEDTRSIVLCMSSQAEKGKFIHAIELAMRKLAMLTTEKTFESVAQSIGIGNKGLEDSHSRSILEAKGSIDELLVVVAGRPPNAEFCGRDVQPEPGSGMVDGEIPLIILSQEKGRLDICASKSGLQIDLSVHQFAIEDCLLGDHKSRRYLAQSVDSGDDYAHLTYKLHYDIDEDQQLPRIELLLDFSSLKCECHRPTIAALIALGLDVSDYLAQKDMDQIQAQSSSDASELMATASDASLISAASLPLDKKYILFHLSLSMAKLELALNYEDSSSANVALAIAENFQYNLDVYTSTIHFTSSLGNMLVYDGALSEKSPYKQICGLKSQSEGSLIKIDFKSHTISESMVNSRVPNGNPFYSVRANISAVELVYFNRWLQEFLFYIFVMLDMTPPHSQISTAASSTLPASAGQETTGAGESSEATATLVLLDIDFKAPVVHMPKTSRETDCIAVDFGHIQVSNNIQWFGRLGHRFLADNILVKCFDLSGKVCKGSTLGSNMIQDLGEGLNIRIWRKLNDPFQSVPMYQVWVDIPTIHFSVSDEEYESLVSIVLENLRGYTLIPGKALELTEMFFPDVREMQAPKVAEDHKPESPKLKRLSSSISRQSSSSRDATRPSARIESKQGTNMVLMKINVDIKSAQLTLTNVNKSGGLPIPLGRIQLVNFQLTYRSIVGGNMSVYMSIPTIEVVDVRPNERKHYPVVVSSSQKGDMDLFGQGGQPPMLKPSLIVLDYEVEGEQQSLNIRLQRPTVIIELDQKLGFLLAITDFAFPSFSLGLKLNKEFRTRDIILGDEVYNATSDIWISPEVRVLADLPGQTEFVLDGNGHRLVLPLNVGPHETLPLILVGARASLTLKNVLIVNSSSLSSVVQIQPGGQLLLPEGDNVALESKDACQSLLPPRRTLRSRISGLTKSRREPASRFLLATSISATGLSVRVIDKLHRPMEGLSESPVQQSLAATLDLVASYKINDTQYNAEAELRNLMVESTVAFRSRGNKGDTGCEEVSSRVLEPCDASLEYCASLTNTYLNVSISQLVVNVAPDLLHVLAAIENLFLNPINVPPSNLPLVSVSTYQKIWCSRGLDNSGVRNVPIYSNSVLERDKGYLSFWRPRAPSGYGIVGDVVTRSQQQCHHQVHVIALNSGLAANPVGYQKIWEDESGAALWHPEAPEDYVAMGCLATTDNTEPATALCLCLHRCTLVGASLGECAGSGPSGCLWSVDNSFRTIVVGLENFDRPSEPFFDIRSPVGISPKGLSLVSSTSSASISLQCYQRFAETRQKLITEYSNRRLMLSTVEFEKIWVDKDAQNGLGAGVWRPKAPHGYSITGDCLEIGSRAPPKAAAVIFDSKFSDFRGSQLLKKPKGYTLVWQDSQGKKDKKLNIYRPIPESGYVPMGFVATIGKNPPDVNLVRCVNLEAVSHMGNTIPHPNVALKWNKRTLFAWVTDDNSKNFVAATLSEQPPTGDMWRLCLPQESPQIQQSSDNKEAVMEFKLHSGPVNIQVRDSHKLPIVEIEMHQLVAVASCRGAVTKSYASFTIALWSHNSMLKAWEPVLENTSLLLHCDQNTSGVSKDGVSPGSQLRVSSTGETIHFTLAYTAFESIMSQYDAFIALSEDDDSAISTRALQNADASTMEITFINLLGCPAYLLNDNGHKQESIMLDVNGRQQVQQCLPLPPQRHDQSLANVLGKQSLILGLLKLEMNLQCQSEGPSLSWVHCEIRMNDARSNCMRTCAYAVEKKSPIVINEQFVIDIPQKENLTTVTLRILETTLSSYGDCIMSGALDVEQLLELTQNGSSTEFTLPMNNIQGCHTGNFITYVSTEFSKGSLVHQKQKEDHQGDRALRLHPADNWVEIPRAGVQMASMGNVLSALDFDMPSLAVAVKAGGGLVMQTGYRGARQETVLRSLCKFVNSTNTSLQVRLVEIKNEPLSSRDSLSSVENSIALQEASVVEEEVYENERKSAMGNFSHENLLFTDRKRFSRKSTGVNNSTNFPNIELEEGWEWLGPWEIEKIGHVDANGWCYAPDFKMMKYPCKKGAHKRKIIDFTRRRRWVRKKRKKRARLPQESSAQDSTIQLGIVQPGCSLPLPMKWSQGLWALQARPIINQKTYHHWSHLVAENENHGLDLANLAQGCRRLGLCQMLVRMSSRPDLPQFLLCSPQFWLSFLVEGMQLPAPVGMEALTDWTITAHPPLLIHNVLPFGGQFMLWERHSGSMLGIREQGCINANEKHPVHGADPRSEVSLSFFPEDCEFRENEPVIISRGYSEQAAGIHGNQQLPPGFRVQKNGIATKVMMERELDVGASQIGKNLDPGVAVAQGFPLVVRLYVPLWVVNNTEAPINIGLVTLPFPSSDQHEGSNGTGSNDIQCITTKPGQTCPFAAHTTCVVSPRSSEIFSYHTGGRALQGVKMMVLGSGWSPPIPLQTGEMAGTPSAENSYTADNVVKQLKSSGSTKNRMLIWAEVPEVGMVVPVLAYLDHTASGFIRTKVLVLEPHILVSNQSGMDIALRSPPYVAQAGATSTSDIRVVPSGSSCSPLKLLLQPNCQAFWAQVKTLDSQWSTPFKVQYPHVGTTHICLEDLSVDAAQNLAPPKSLTDVETETRNRAALTIQVSILGPGCLHVNFLTVGGRPPYKLENKTLYPLLFRQQGMQEPWNRLPPLSAQGWVLPRVGSDKGILEVQGATSGRISCLVPLNASHGEANSHTLALGDGPRQGIIEVVEVEEVCVSRPNLSFGSAVQTWGGGQIIRALQNTWNEDQSASLTANHESPSAFKFNLRISSLSISLVDQIPEELLLLTIDGIGLEICTGMGSKGRFSHAELTVKNVQLDDQLSDSVYPVLAAAWRKKKDKEGPNAVYCKIVQESGMRQGHLKYPMIALRLGDLQFAIHETVIWRMHSLMELVQSSLPTNNGSASDVGLEIGHLQLYGLKTKISVSTDPSSRPRFSQPISLGLEFANVEDIEVEIKGYEADQLSMPQSVFEKQLMAHLKSQAAGIILSLLDFYFSVGGVSQALSVVGKAIQTAVDDPGTGSLRKTVSKVDSFQDGLVEGTTALGKGLFDGFAGVLRKPILGAKEDGIVGFFGGAAKGIAGVALTPISGVFEAASKVTEGFDVLTSRADDMPTRRRLPLSFRGDRVLRPFDQMEAAWQMLLHSVLPSQALGEREAYEGHRILNSATMVIWTRERLVLVGGSGLQELQHSIAMGGAPTAYPNVKVVWWLGWDNTLSVNYEVQTHGQQQGLVVVYAKRQVSSFQYSFRHGLKTTPDICNPNDLCGELWESMVRYSHLGTRPQQSAAMLIPGMSYPPQMNCTDFELVWKSHGGLPTTVWSPKCPPGYVSLGQVFGKQSDPTSVPVYFDDSSSSKTDQPPRLAKPLRFVLIFRDTNPRTGKLSVWNPIAPFGYKSLGSLIVPDLDRPSRDQIRCLREDLCIHSQFSDVSIWRGGSSDIEDAQCSLWSKQRDPYNSFYAVQGLQKPVKRPAVIPAPNLGQTLI